MNLFILWLLIACHFFGCLSPFPHASDIPDLPDFKLRKNGDLVLGGLFPVHDYDKYEVCSASLKSRGFYVPYLYSMIYAIEQINNDTSLLPNISLGYLIVDSCGKASTALGQSLNFIASDWNTGRDELVVSGVIGGAYSSTTSSVAQLLNSFHVPQISYTASSSELSDNAIYRYLFRTMISDDVLLAAILDIINHFRWKYISVLYVDDMYGRNAMKFFKRVTSEHGICLALSLELPLSMTSFEHYDKLASNLIAHKKARVVIVFSFRSSGHARGLIEAMDRANMTGHFVFFAPDGWAESVDEFAGYERESLGIISIKPLTGSVRGFNDWFRRLQTSEIHRNPWLQQYWTDIVCNGSAECDKETFAKHPDVPRTSLVVDAVYAFAYALQRVIADNCSLVERDRLRNCASGDAIALSLKNITMKSFSYQRQVAFDSNGDIYPEMVSVSNLQEVSPGIYDLVKIGTWDGGSQVLDLNDSRIRWPGKQPQVPPQSVCSPDCPAKHYRFQLDKSCCWECKRCRTNERLINNKTECAPCRVLTWPDPETQTICLDIVPDFIHWKEPSSIYLLLPAIMGLVVTSLTASLFVYFRKAPLIKACSRELSITILIGIGLGYSVVFGLLTQPGHVTCFVNHFGFDLSFTFVYASLATRTNRIYRMFNAGRKSGVNPKFVSKASQVVIATVLILLQVRITSTLEFGFVFVVVNIYFCTV